MSIKIAYTAILSFQPYVNRSEHLNYGVVVFMPEGGVKVVIEDDLSKILAFYPKADLAVLRDKVVSIPDLVKDADLDRVLGILNAFRELRDVQKKDLGCFEYKTEEEFDRWVKILIKDTCSVID